MARKVEGYVLICGRAFEREGFTGFFRGGVKWPSDLPGRFALVTPQLLAVLKAEKKLSIDTDPELPEDFDVEQLERLDVPPRTFIDHAALALDESKRLDREIAAEKARLENAKKAAELARLRAEREAAEKGEIKASKAEKPVEKPKA